MKRLAGFVAYVTSCIAVAAITHAQTKGAVPVRVELGTMTLPTYEEGPPDVNPSFDLFATRFTYPYTVRQNLTIAARRTRGGRSCSRTSI